MDPAADQLETNMPAVPAPPLGLGVVALLAVAGATFIVLFTTLLILPFIRFDPVTAKPVVSALIAGRVGIPAELLAYAGLLGVIYVLFRQSGVISFWRHLEWNWPSWRKTIAFAGLGMALAFAVTALPVPIPPNLPIEVLLQDRWTLAMFLVFAPLPAPFVEEVYFRGLLFPALRSHIGSLAAILVTALLFALLHGVQLAFTPWPLAILFLTGWVLTWIRARSGSVACSFLVHSAYNIALLAGEMVARFRAH